MKNWLITNGLLYESKFDMEFTQQQQKIVRRQSSDSINGYNVNQLLSQQTWINFFTLCD